MPKLNRISIKDNSTRKLPPDCRVRFEHWETNRVTARNEVYRAHHTKACVYKLVNNTVQPHEYKLLAQATAVTSPKDLYLRKVGNHIALQRALKLVPPEVTN